MIVVRAINPVVAIVVIMVEWPRGSTRIVGLVQSAEGLEFGVDDEPGPVTQSKTIDRGRVIFIWRKIKPMPPFLCMRRRCRQQRGYNQSSQVRVPLQFHSSIRAARSFD